MTAYNCKKHGKPNNHIWHEKPAHGRGMLTRIGCADCEAEGTGRIASPKPKAIKPPIKKVNPASLSRRRAI
jgi:hypothetical protein